MIQLSNNYQKDDCQIFVLEDIRDLKKFKIENSTLIYFQNQADKDLKQIVYNNGRKLIIADLIKQSDEQFQTLENARKAANAILPVINSQKYDSVTIINTLSDNDTCLAYAEGLALSNYQFLNYYKDSNKRKNTLNEINVYGNKIKEKEIIALNNLVESVYTAKDLVNYPPNYLTATVFAETMEEMGSEAGLRVTVFDKDRIIKEGMGGLLAVNRGSIEPPTFTVLEWNNSKSKNKKPYIIVGKGVTYDTGGLSLKPTDGMDTMKADMAGASAVFATMLALAKNNVSLHVIGLIPSTDNRPGENAFTNGDVIKMHSGLTVEVLNTDAEGRMILADALSFAQKYKPELVLDIATLTGAASMAVGKEAIVAMGNDKKAIAKLRDCSFDVFERIVELPFWDEYSDYLKSDIADMKNIGGRQAGAITAGKFLEKFTNYPYVHIDIAGSAFLQQPDSYRGKGATGVGVRLLFEFLKRQV